MTAELEVGPVQQLEDHLKQYEEVYSYSELDTFQRCRRKWYYGYGLRLGEAAPAVAADAGTVMHAAIAKLWKTNDVDQSVAALNEVYDKLFAWVEPAGFDLAKQYKRDHLLKVFLRYGLDVFRNDKLPPISPAFVEIGFIVEMDDPRGKEPPAMLYGRMDWVGKSEIDGHVAPVDTKTTKSWGADFTARYDPDIQGDLYTYVTKRLLPNENIRGFYINGILLQVTKIEFNRILIPRKQLDIDEFEAETFWWITQLRQTRADKFYPKSTNQCTAYGECPFRKICTGHMNPNTINLFPHRGPKGFHFTSGD